MKRHYSFLWFALIVSIVYVILLAFVLLTCACSSATPTEFELTRDYINILNVTTAAEATRRYFLTATPAL